jgi:hypothetical protein
MFSSYFKGSRRLQYKHEMDVLLSDIYAVYSGILRKL